MVDFQVKREVIKGKYFLVARDYSKSKRGRVLDKVAWNQKVKSEFRERIKKINVYKKDVFNKKVEVQRLSKESLTREVTRTDKRIKKGQRFQVVCEIKLKGYKQKFYGRSKSLTDKSGGAFGVAKESAKQNAVQSVGGVVLNDSNKSFEDISYLVETIKFKIVYYENLFFK